VTTPDDKWITGLSGAIANSLVEFRGKVQEQIVIFAVDCHPWNGVLDLALLTASEVKHEPLLADPAEMAAWRHFHFSSGLASWRAAAELELQMRAAYERAGEDRAGVAEDYFRACAAAVASSRVQQSLSGYKLRDDFRISVPHPDTEKEYYTPT